MVSGGTQKHWFGMLTSSESRLCFETKELLSDEDHITRFEFNFFFQLDERPVATAFICEDESAPSLLDARVPSGHEAIVREGNLAAGSSNHGIIPQLVDLARLAPFHNKM